MRMNAPKWVTWLIALIIGVVGILLKLNVISVPFLERYDFLLVAAAFGLLILATLFKKL